MRRKEEEKVDKGRMKSKEVADAVTGLVGQPNKERQAEKNDTWRGNAEKKKKKENRMRNEQRE